MNKNIVKPLILQFIPPEREPVMRRSSKSVFIPVNVKWAQFKDTIMPLISSPAYDSVLVHTRDDVDRDMKGVVGNMAIKMNAIAGAGTRVNKPVLSYESADKPFYYANPSTADLKGAGPYAPSDEMIMEKYESFESDDAWQEYQSKIWDRMKDMMPLSRKTDEFNRDHAEQLKDPKRGLEEKDLDKFWSFKSRKNLSPTIMGDNMVGMPSVEGREYEGFTMSNVQPDGSVEVKPLKVRSLMTTGASGIAIPMANANGHVNKHQIAADLTAYGTVLHFRAEDGKTVAKGELFSKKTREYSFTFADGTPTHLKAIDVAQDNTITFQDEHGIFNVKPKKEIVDVLKDRGYVVPDIITSVKPEQNGKYMWQSPGTMTGSEAVLKTVSPSNPGFIMAREPKNGSDQYVVLVAEGALKGQIVAKYINVTDKDGVCFGDKIAGNNGIIVTQVPGVAESYVKNAVAIYDKYNVKGTYIAMDADGRENRNVARGIHTAYNYINKFNPATVLSWDPAQKGMDDALLAVAQGKITVADMNLVSGTPEALFPLDKAHVMTPYKLNGSQLEVPSWLQEYREDTKERQEKVAAMQAETAAREEQFVEGTKIGQWMETPKDIHNIQNATVAKAADMADAMAGKLPAMKADAKTVPTPDVDELIEDDEESELERPVSQAEEPAKEAVVKNEIEDAIRKWDTANPEMPPLPVPGGYKAAYNYEQAVMTKAGTALEISDSFRYSGPFPTVDGNSWGIVDMESDHEMHKEEKEYLQRELRAGNAICVGDMRLTSQSFTLDQEMHVELTNADLNMGEPDNGRGL